MNFEVGDKIECVIKSYAAYGKTYTVMDIESNMITCEDKNGNKVLLFPNEIRKTEG